jgi:hypothetical protein
LLPLLDVPSKYGFVREIDVEKKDSSADVLKEKTYDN